MNTEIYSVLMNYLPRSGGSQLYVISSSEGQTKVVLLPKKYTPEIMRSALNQNGIIRVAEKGNEVFIRVHESQAEALKNQKLDFGNKKVTVQVLDQAEYDQEFASLIATMMQ